MDIRNATTIKTLLRFEQQQRVCNNLLLEYVKADLATPWKRSAEALVNKLTEINALTKRTTNMRRSSGGFTNSKTTKAMSKMTKMASKDKVETMYPDKKTKMMPKKMMKGGKY